MTTMTGDKVGPGGPPLCMNKVAEYFGTIGVKILRNIKIA